MELEAIELATKCRFIRDEFISLPICKKLVKLFPQETKELFDIISYQIVNCTFERMKELEYDFIDYLKDLEVKANNNADCGFLSSHKTAIEKFIQSNFHTTIDPKDNDINKTTATTDDPLDIPFYDTYTVPGLDSINGVIQTATRLSIRVFENDNNSNTSDTENDCLPNTDNTDTTTTITSSTNKIIKKKNNRQSINQKKRSRQDLADERLLQIVNNLYTYGQEIGDKLAIKHDIKYVDKEAYPELDTRLSTSTPTVPTHANGRAKASTSAITLPKQSSNTSNQYTREAYLYEDSYIPKTQSRSPRTSRGEGTASTGTNDNDTEQSSLQPAVVVVKKRKYNRRDTAAVPPSLQADTMLNDKDSDDDSFVAYYTKKHLKSKEVRDVVTPAPPTKAPAVTLSGIKPPTCKPNNHPPAGYTKSGKRIGRPPWKHLSSPVSTEATPIVPSPAPASELVASSASFARPVAPTEPRAKKRADKPVKNVMPTIVPVQRNGSTSDKYISLQPLVSLKPSSSFSSTSQQQYDKQMTATISGTSWSSSSFNYLNKHNSLTSSTTTNTIIAAASSLSLSKLTSSPTTKSTLNSTTKATPTSTSNTPSKSTSKSTLNITHIIPTVAPTRRWVGVEQKDYSGIAEYVAKAKVAGKIITLGNYATVELAAR